ncbi:hypothetical protein, partial [Aeromonas caviae]|uniref:hypothetical protein n=1 Tax=Aeromonas caviae TaxID=648 RepID=UPI001C2F5746
LNGGRGGGYRKFSAARCFIQTAEEFIYRALPVLIFMHIYLIRQPLCPECHLLFAPGIGQGESVNILLN